MSGNHRTLAVRLGIDAFLSVENDHNFLLLRLTGAAVQGSGYRIVHLLPIAILAFLLGYFL